MNEHRSTRLLGALWALGLAAVSCGGDDSGETDSAPVASIVDSQPTTVPSSAPADSQPADSPREAAVDDVEPTTCESGRVPAPDDNAADAPPPVVATDEDPAWVTQLREPRIVDGTHLLSDLELRQSRTAPFLLESGVYETTSFGGSSTLTLDEPWRLMRADPGLLVLRGAEDTQLQDRPSLLIGWSRGVPSAEAASSVVDSPIDQTTLIDVPHDLSEWFDEIGAVTVTGCSPIELFGESGAVYDVEVDPDAGETSFCMPIGSCVTSFGWYTGGPATDTTVHLSDRYAYRIWHVPHPKGAFVAVAISVAEDFDAWTARSARLLTGLDADLADGPPLTADQFGSGRGVLDVGSVSPLSLPTLNVELSNPVWAATFARTFIVGPLDEAPPWQDGPYADVVVVDTGVGGPISDIDGALAALGEVGTVDELADETMLGRPATVVSVTADAEARVFRTTTAEPGTAAEEEGFGWWWVAEGPQTIWLIPVGDRLFAVSAAPEPGGELDDVVGFARSVLATATVDR